MLAVERKRLEEPEDASGSDVKVPKPRHAATILRWDRAVRRHGLVGLVDRWWKSGNRGSYFRSEERELLDQCAQGYCSDERPTKVIIWRRTRVRFAAVNQDRVSRGLTPLRVPSREAVRAAINRLDAFEVAVARIGRDWAMRKLAPVGQCLEVVRPLERVVLDEYKLDVIAICTAMRRKGFFTDEEWHALGLDGKKKRWWLGVAFDSASRVVLGMVLSREPSVAGALATLEQVFTDKSDWSKAAGTRSSWHHGGRPEGAVTDCGTLYDKTTFRAAAEAMGVFVQKTAARSPEDRADIERFFRTVATELLPNLPGRTFSNVVERGDYASKDKAAVDIDDLIRLLTVWVVDVYHFSPHKGLGGATPYDTYENLVEQYGVLPWGNTRALRLAFGKRLTRKVQRNGITIVGVTYSSEALQRWRLHSRKHEVSVRWHAKDIGCIDVEFDGAWREVGAVVEGFHGRNAQDWIAAARQIRASNQQIARIREDTVLKALADIDAIADAARKRADLLVNDWSPERIEALEDRLFGGFVVASPPAMEAAEPSKPRTLLGTIIPVGGDAAGHVPASEDDVPPEGPNADAAEELDDDDGWGIDR